MCMMAQFKFEDAEHTDKPPTSFVHIGGIFQIQLSFSQVAWFHRWYGGA